MGKVSLIIGSTSDKELGDNAEEVLKEFEIDYDYQVISSHRNPDYLADYIGDSDADIFIAIAGLSAALPGTIAAHTVKPVIGVPKDVRLGGLDSLLSIVQMPTGVPVATVAIDNPKNAALLAIEILALSDEKLEEKLIKYREKRAKK
ncbi:MAG: 5-(carboxyamino)imidazole ribonucleotide mutase [Candidatus Bathyarchaeia archaeon]